VARRLARDLADAFSEMAEEIARLWAQWQQRRVDRNAAPVGAGTDDALGGERDA
jgi:hypothetical protein